MVISALFLGAMLSLLAAGPAFDRLGQYPVFMAGAALMGLGAMGLTGQTTLPAVLFCAFVTGLGTAMDLSCNLVIAEVFADRRAAAVSLLNVFFGFGAVLGPLTAKCYLEAMEHRIPGAVAGGADAAAAAHHSAHGDGAAGQGSGAGHSARPEWSERAAALAAIVGPGGADPGVCGARKRHVQLDDHLSGQHDSVEHRGRRAGLGWFLAGAGGWAHGGGLLRVRFPAKAILLATLVGALAGGGLLAASTGNAPLTVVAVLLTGFCYGPVFPVVFAIANATFRDLAGTASSVVIAMGSLGRRAAALAARHRVRSGWPFCQHPAHHGRRGCNADFVWHISRRQPPRSHLRGNGLTNRRTTMPDPSRLTLSPRYSECDPDGRLHTANTY